MCVTHVKTYVHPNGHRETFERLEYCLRSNGQSPCRSHQRRKHPDQLVASSSAMGSPSLVDDDDGPTSSSGSVPSTPPQIEIREPSGQRRGSGSSAKGKAKRTINPQDYRVQFSSSRQSSRRTDEPSPRARFADDERSDATVPPKTPSPPRRGRAETPAPSIFRTPAPTGHGSPLKPSMRRTQAEVHQSNPPSPRSRRPVPSRPRRSPTESTETRGSSSSRTDSTDADVYTRPEHRARARESLQRQERERRREEEEDRRRQEQEEDRRSHEQAEAEREARERAEDEHSLREYNRINAREGIRLEAEARRRRFADVDQLKGLEERVNVLLGKAREQSEQEQVGRIAREIRERRERIREELRREAEAETPPRDEHRHDAERRREVDLQEAVSQMSTRGTDEDGAKTAEEIRRITNDIELQREARRQQEREEERRELRRIELFRIKALEDEIRHLERELRQPADAQYYSDHRPEYRNTWHGSPYYYHHHGPWHNHAPPQIPPRTLTPYPTGWPSSGNSVPIHPRYLHEDPYYRRAHGERVLQQERWRANARDRVEMQQAANNNVAIMSGGLHRRNTLGGGGREREMAYRWPIYYPWWQ